MLLKNLNDRNIPEGSGTIIPTIKSVLPITSSPSLGGVAINDTNKNTQSSVINSSTLLPPLPPTVQSVGGFGFVNNSTANWNP